MNLLDLIFPKKCLECGKEGQYICGNCLMNVSLRRYKNGNFSVFKYKSVIRKAIISLKYKFAYDVVSELVSVSVDNIPELDKNIILVPIPLHKHKNNWRGFNQTELLGEKIAKQMKWRYIPNLLLKTVKSKQQVGLKGQERRKNLSGVFVVNSKILPSYNTYNLLHNTIVLFDDVYTTGTTINEAKKVLQKAGFKNIKSLTIAG